MGNNPLVMVDFDGGPRPIGRDYDIGMDEAGTHALLPLAAR